MTVQEEFKGPHLLHLRVGHPNRKDTCTDFLNGALGWNEPGADDIGRRFFLTLTRNNVGQYDAHDCASFDLGPDDTQWLSDTRAEHLELARQIAPPVPAKDFIDATAGDDSSSLPVHLVIALIMLGGTVAASVAAFIVLRRRAT